MSRHYILNVRTSPKDDIPIAGPKMSLSLSLLLCNAPGWEIGSDRNEKGKRGKAYVSCKPLFSCSCQLIPISGVEDPCNPVLRFHVMDDSRREALFWICFRYSDSGGNYISRDLPVLIRPDRACPLKIGGRVQAAASSQNCPRHKVASCKLQTRIVISLSITLASHHEPRQTPTFRGSESLQAGRDTATIHLVQPRQLVHKCSIRQCYRFTAYCSSENDRSNCSAT